MLDMASIKDVVGALKKEQARANSGPKLSSRSARSSLLSKIGPRRASTVAPPLVPDAIHARAFAVLQFRDGHGVSFLRDWEVKEEGESAYLTIDRHMDDAFLEHDQVAFYFTWVNDSDNDVTVNFQTSLIISGFCMISADAGLIHTPFWGVGTNGEITAGITAELAVMEWWNQPPTQAVQQPAANITVRHASASGGYINDTEQTMTIDSETYYLHQDGFRVPAHGPVVIEVSLNLYYGGGHGARFAYDYRPEDQNHQTVCPYVQIDVA